MNKMMEPTMKELNNLEVCLHNLKRSHASQEYAKEWVYMPNQQKFQRQNGPGLPGGSQRHLQGKLGGEPQRGGEPRGDQ